MASFFCLIESTNKSKKLIMPPERGLNEKGGKNFYDGFLSQSNNDNQYEGQ
jgi:hypothetical protein